MISWTWHWLYTHVDPIYALVLAGLAAIAALGLVAWYFQGLRAFAGALSLGILGMLFAFRKGEDAQAARDQPRAWRWPWQ